MAQQQQQATAARPPQTALAVANQKVDQFKKFMELRRASLAEVLPKHLTPERVCKVALIAYSKTPKLRDCTTASVWQSIMQAAELGLEPGGALGHAYLVPYKDQCTLIPGYRGLIELARRSGEIESIEAHVVYERDTFSLKFGFDARLDHEPFLDGDPGAMRFVYAIAKLKGGAVQSEVMTKAQVDKIKSRSKASSNGPWVTDYEEMARKTVVRRLCKYLPLSTEKSEALARALELEDDGPVIDITASEGDAQPTVAKTRTDKVKEQLKASEQTVDSVVVEGSAVEVANPEPQANG